MAIQFPNFLSVPVRTPDYSGISDIVENYYKGKAMPKDDLIKAIQAEFARPNAEQSLLSSQLSNSGKRLSNRKEQLDIDKLVRDAAEQKAFEEQLRQALGGGRVGGAAPSGGSMQGGGMQGGGSPAAAIPPNMNPAALSQALNQPTGLPVGQPSVVTDPNQFDDGLDRTQMAPRYRKFDQMATGLPNTAYTPGAPGAQMGTAGTAGTPAAPPMAPPVSQAAPQEEAPHEIVVAQGSPHLQGIDAMWDNNPLSREFLKKKGYEKKQEIKFNAKTGQTTIITKYPSGTITTQSVSGAGSTSGDVPLTNKMVSKHQNIIASVDVALPVIKELADMGSYPRQSIYRGGQYGEYEGKVSQAIDSVLGAFGLPITNEGMKTIRDQVEIKTFETPAHYKKRLEKLIEDLKKRKDYSAGEVKRSNKISPVSGSDPYGLSDYDTGSGDNTGES